MCISGAALGQKCKDDREHVQELIFRSGCCWGNNRVPFGSSVLSVKGILKQTQQVTFIRDYEDRQQTGKFLIMAAAQRRGTSKEEAMSFQVSFLEIQQIQQWQWWVVSEENYLGQNVQTLSNTQKKKDSFKKNNYTFSKSEVGQVHSKFNHNRWWNLCKGLQFCRRQGFPERKSFYFIGKQLLFCLTHNVFKRNRFPDVREKPSV